MEAGASGVSIKFDCKASGRFCKFAKTISLNADLDMVVTPDRDQPAYSTKIKFQK